MNITKQIAERIGGEIEVLIKETPEIQFYAIYGPDMYQWRDGRYKESSDVWANKKCWTRQEVINDFKTHLESKKATE